MSTEAQGLGAGADITRRDLINGAVAAAGATLVGGCGRSGPASEAATGAVSPWTGYGGVGDYATSNGNTEAVMNAAHLVRDGAHDTAGGRAEDEGRDYDLIVVGGGFAGINAAHELRRAHGTTHTCLLLENHPVFGGEAKQNEFNVDGHRLYGPQGSNDFLVPTGDHHHARLWRELGLPTSYEFASPPPGSPKVPLDNFGPMYWQPEQGPTGYRFGSQWIIDAASDGFARAPIEEGLRKDVARLWSLRAPPREVADFERWLDGMTYRAFLTDELKLSQEVAPFVDPLLATANHGFGSDVISAFAAFRTGLPGVRAYGPAAEAADPTLLMSFPGGNSAIARHAVKALLPDAIAGSGFADTLEGPINFAALDRRDNWLRMRMGATVVRVEHVAGNRVAITYAKDGRLHRARTRAAVMASGGWITRQIVRDMPDRLAEAYRQFHHGPMLVANVALRNWRFLDRLGFTSARWFDGFGFFANIRRPMIVGGRSAPCDPKLPIVMTFYVPFAQPGHDIAAQGALARAALLQASFADIELKLRRQMTDLFAGAGFDAARDIAGIVLNRWGHAFISPQPGFHFGTATSPSPLEIVREGHDRITFGHSDTVGQQNWWSAIEQSTRATKQALAVMA